MLDWSVVIIPLAVLAIVLLLPFAGCGLEDYGQSAEGTHIPITLSWSGNASEIRSISFQASVQELDSSGNPVSLVSPTGDAAIAWDPDFLPSAGDMSLDAKVEEPLALSYIVTGVATVTQGAWQNEPPESYPFTLPKTISGLPPTWQFTLMFVDGKWYFN